MISEIYMTNAEAEQINGTTIKSMFARFAPLLELRQNLFKYYDREDATIASMDNPVVASIFSPIARYATDIAAGYFIGNPCRYYSRVTTTVRTIEKFGSKKSVFEKKLTGEPDEAETEKIQAYLNGYQAVLRKNHEDEENIELARHTLIYRTAYERIYVVKDKDGYNDIRFKAIDPKKCVLIRDNTVERNPVAFLCREQFTEPLTGMWIDQYEVITNKRHVYYRFKTAFGSSGVSVESGSVMPPEEISADEADLNLIRLIGIPIVEYRMPGNKGFFEDCIPLLNARDFLLNNVRNTFRYNDDAILLMIGFMKPSTEEEAEKFKKSLADFKTLWMGDDTDVKWLIKDVPIDSIRGYFDMLTNDIFGMLGIKNPVRSSEAYQNITTVRYQNYGMDNTVLGLERSFERGLLEGRARMITALLNFVNGTDWDWEKLDVAFDRNLPSSRVEEAQFIAQMKGADIMADEDILDQVQFVENSHEAVLRKRAQDKYEAEQMAEESLEETRNTVVTGLGGSKVMNGSTENGVERGDGRLREDGQAGR